MNVNPSTRPIMRSLGTRPSIFSRRKRSRHAAGTTDTPGTLDYLTVTVTGLNCRLIGAPSGVLATPLT
jgi:hypothetical protein